MHLRYTYQERRRWWKSPLFDASIGDGTENIVIATFYDELTAQAYVAMMNRILDNTKNRYDELQRTGS